MWGGLASVTSWCRASAALPNDSGQMFSYFLCNTETYDIIQIADYARVIFKYARTGLNMMRLISTWSCWFLTFEKFTKVKMHFWILLVLHEIIISKVKENWRHDWLWVRFPPEEMKYITLGSASQHLQISSESEERFKGNGMS